MGKPSRTSDNATISDKYRDVAAANSRRETHSGMDMEGDNQRHIDTYKFDKEADTAAQADYLKKHPLSPLFTTEGQPINTEEKNRARVAAQMASHKNPKNRVS